VLEGVNEYWLWTCKLGRTLDEDVTRTPSLREWIRKTVARNVYEHWRAFTSLWRSLWRQQ